MKIFSVLFVVVSSFLFLPGTALGQTFTPFTWPTSNSGPYTLVSNATNYTVFMPNDSVSTENDMASHKYQHHTRIWNYQSNITWIAFSSGCTNEDDMGQQCAMCWSTNRGQTWSSPPTQVVPSQSAWGCGFSPTNYRISHPRSFKFYSGTNYLVCGVEDDFGGVGAALIAVALNLDGSIGTPFLISTNAYGTVDGKAIPTYDSNLGPPLMALSRGYDCWGGTWHNFSPVVEWGWCIWAMLGDYIHVWDEPNTFSVDGTTNNLYRIWRQTSGPINMTNVWQQMSTNGGLTWPVDPVVTSVPNQPSEVTGLRLTTGQYALIGNPVNNPVNPVLRDPLYLALSESNTTTITNVLAIRQGLGNSPVYHANNGSKGGGAQYPGAVQVGNYLYVSYSIAKESVGFSRVLIPGMVDNNNDTWTNLTASVVNIQTLNISGSLTVQPAP